ncbi:MAG: hypothetical protein M3R55_04610 [Acidobacteriota bacterium]|nr:hypothetical protein [Acidobacteriota bacterium]
MAWKRDGETERKGDVLGLSGAVIPTEREEGIDRPSNGEGVGAAGEVERIADPMGGLKRSKGATGIDMGAGGNGTDIEP